MGGDEGLPAGGRRRRRSPAAAPPLDNDDLLSDILLRLPPTPSYLPRVSLVCKRWRRLVSAPAFARSFRARHRRNAPLLGFFTQRERTISFTSTLDPPDRLPSEHFSLDLEEDRCRILSCRHGLVLIHNPMDRQLLVWEPVTGDLSSVALPPEFGGGGSRSLVFQHAAVLRAPSDAGEGHSAPFLVAWVGSDLASTRAFACVYSSQAGAWGNLISTACPYKVPKFPPSTLIGSSLYWLIGPMMAILEFDLDRCFLAVIDAPLNNCDYDVFRHRVMPAEGGGLGFLCLSGCNAQLWMRKLSSDGIAGWVLRRTIELDKLLSLNSEGALLILGLAEEDNMSFLLNGIDVTMVQLGSSQFKKLFRIKNICIYHPFASVYTPGMGICGGHDGAEPLHDT
ncbi:unnamed protein product [Urochloa decumbens]|uniref:F-box domain-containing protein n=1 Tax=Urochloa decumbens TaxID=240449 RepID=A0ABC9A0I3_9POAL